MIPRRVTRSATRAAAAANNAAPAPAPPPPPPVAPALTNGANQTIQTRSKKILGQVATAVQRVTRPRRSRKTVEPDDAQPVASTSNAASLPSNNPPTIAPVPAPPPRKRARKGTQAAITSFESEAGPSSVPVPVPAPRKRAVAKKEPNTARGTSTKGKGKAKAIEPATPPPHTAEPSPEAVQASAFSPVPTDEYDRLNASIRQMNATLLTAKRCGPRPQTEFRSVLGARLYKYVPPPFSYVREYAPPPRHPFDGTAGYAQPAQPAAEGGHETGSRDGGVVAIDDEESSHSESAPESTPVEQEEAETCGLQGTGPLDINIGPSTDSHHGRLTRQDATNLECPEGVPVAGPSSQGQTEDRPFLTGAQKLALGKKYGLPPAAESNPADDGFVPSYIAPDPAEYVHLPPSRLFEPSAEVIERLKKYNAVPLRREGYTGYETQPSVKHQADRTQTVSEKPAEAAISPFPSAPVVDTASQTEGETSSSPTQPRKNILTRGAELTPAQVAGNEAYERANAPQTTTRRRVPPGHELRRHHAVLILPDGEVVPYKTMERERMQRDVTPLGLATPDALSKLDAAQVKAAGTEQARPSTPEPVAAPAASSVKRELSPRSLKLSRTPSLQSLGLLGTSRGGPAFPFSRKTPQSSRLPQDPPRTDSKGKGRALPTVEEAPVAPLDKGKKRARSPEDDEDDLAEVEHSLMVDSEEEDADAGAEASGAAGVPDGLAEDMDVDEGLLLGRHNWPREYVMKKSLFRVEVSVVPMEHLPVGRIPEGGQPLVTSIVHRPRTAPQAPAPAPGPSRVGAGTPAAAASARPAPVLGKRTARKPEREDDDSAPARKKARV